MIIQTIEAKLARLQILCIPGRIGDSSLATFHPTLNNETVKQNCNVIAMTELCSVLVQGFLIL
jgi:hypothetical protein